MTIEEMIERKNDMGYTYEKVAQLSGLSPETVQDVLDGIIKFPGEDTLRALENVFKEPRIKYDSDAAGADYFNEGIPYMAGSSAEKIPSKKQGEYTLDDYYALPDERRVELIDGVIYDMASPTFIHQTIALRLGMAFSGYIDGNHGKCIAAVAPMDVQLDKDNKTMIQPDVMIICDRSKIKKRVVYGAPDLVVEVLSPSTYKKDIRLKLKKYRAAGVREYWIVDPDDHAVTVYKFGDMIDFKIYEVNEDELAVPVGIFDDKCIVDLGEIFELVSEFEEE